MKIVIAPNSFKGSLNAFEVAQSIQTGLQKSALDASCQLFPIADGGDHTLEVFHHFFGGKIHNTLVRGPLGKEVSVTWATIENGQTAVIELAKASGLSLVENNTLNPLKANTFGTGQLIKAAIGQGAKKIILGLGGSATVDGGLGILQALGAELLDEAGKVIGTNTNPLMEIADISVAKIAPKTHALPASEAGLPTGMHEIEFVILCDVDNPLLGKHGSAHVFGPQKGAGPKAVEMLEKSMKRYNQILISKTGNDLSLMEGSGAAGGIAIALKSFFPTSLVSGVDFLLEKMGFELAISEADLLITAEGRVDKQTLQGKGPAGVANKAKNHGVPTIILAGQAENINELNATFDGVFPITNGPMNLKKAMQKTREDLEATACQIGNLLAVGSTRGKS